MKQQVWFRLVVSLLLASLVWGLGACTPSPGPFRLDAVSGRVVDAATGAAVAGAEVVEWYRGRSMSDVPGPVYEVRWTTTADDGSFSFPSTLASSPRTWTLETYGPSYALYHPEYGMQRGARAGPEGLVLRADRARAEMALADLRPFCSGEFDDAGSRRIAALGCERNAPSRPAR